jgi:hypothetical protein
MAHILEKFQIQSKNTAYYVFLSKKMYHNRLLLLFSREKKVEMCEK